MVAFSERYGYEVVFPEKLQEKLVKLAQTDKDSYNEMNTHIKKLFPYIYHIASDMVSTDWNWDKEEAQEANKEIQKAIRKWFKEYESKEK